MYVFATVKRVQNCAMPVIETQTEDYAFGTYVIHEADHHPQVDETMQEAPRAPDMVAEQDKLQQALDMMNALLAQNEQLRIESEAMQKKMTRMEKQILGVEKNVGVEIEVPSSGTPDLDFNSESEPAKLAKWEKEAEELKMRIAKIEGARLIRPHQ